MNKSIVINRRIREVNEILAGMERSEKFIAIDARPELKYAHTQLYDELNLIRDQIDIFRKKYFVLDDISEEEYNDLLSKLDEITKKCYLVRFPYESVMLNQFRVVTDLKYKPTTYPPSKSTLAYVFDSIPSIAWILLAYGAMWRLSTPTKR